MQTIQIDKINNYSCGDNYQPLKISVDIIPPLILTNPWLYLDGILSYLCLRDALGEDYWCLPTERVIDISKLDLPLKKTEDIYHASVGIYENPILKKNTIYKRFTDKESFHLSEKQQQGKIRINAGHYKDFMINLPSVITSKVTWYCNGDKEELNRLLSNLTNLGKKTSIGAGYIKKIQITEIKEDYSFIKDEQVMRPIPHDLIKLPIKAGDTWARCTYKPPYWDNNNIELCKMPVNQLIS